MYNSMLYGNGLTLAVLSTIKENFSNEFICYLDCDDFIFEFIYAEPHKRIYRDFIKYFLINKETEKVHNEARKIIKRNYKEISSYGFERWVSKYLFSSNTDYKKIKEYAYFLYNYWFYIVSDSIIKKAIPKEIINNLGNNILKILEDNAKIFTTNFDTIMDDVLNPSHIHGKFQIPLNGFNDIIAFHINDKEFEYKYLFGANGFEKMYRLNRINNNGKTNYEIDFFYEDTLDLGSLLIYGLSFRRTEFISEEFLALYPEHRTNKLVNTVDGHILYKLSIKYDEKKLKKITIAYFSNLDKDNYQDLFKNTNLENIVEYKYCEELINF